MVKRFGLVSALVVLVSFSIAYSQTAEKGENQDTVQDAPRDKSTPVIVPKFDIAPTIDGNLDEEVWKKAAQFKDFVQTQPGDRIPPSKKTVAYIGYDEKNLYIAFFCFDEPDKIRATVAKRDSVEGEDYVGVFLDTFDDQRRAYIFPFNLLGIQVDGIKSARDHRSDFNLDIVMESKGLSSRSPRLLKWLSTLAGVKYELANYICIRFSISF